MYFNTVENDIKPILKNDEAARCDDMVLYADYVYKKLGGNNLGSEWLIRVFSNRRFRIEHGIVPYETVSRIRRKLQREYEELKPSKEYLEERKRAEKDYRKYAKEKRGAKQ